MPGKAKRWAYHWSKEQIHQTYNRDMSVVVKITVKIKHYPILNFKIIKPINTNSNTKKNSRNNCNHNTASGSSNELDGLNQHTATIHNNNKVSKENYHIHTL